MPIESVNTKKLPVGTIVTNFEIKDPEVPK